MFRVVDGFDWLRIRLTVKISAPLLIATVATVCLVL